MLLLINLHCLSYLFVVVAVCFGGGGVFFLVVFFFLKCERGIFKFALRVYKTGSNEVFYIM